MGKTERQYEFKTEWFEEEKKGDIYAAFEYLLFNAFSQLRPIGMLHSSSNKHTEKASIRFYLKEKLKHKKLQAEFIWIVVPHLNEKGRCKIGLSLLVKNVTFHQLS